MIKISCDPSTVANVPDISARIAGRVRKLRTVQDFSLDALAMRSGVSKSMISLIERGEVSPTVAVLEKLAVGLGVSIAALFEPNDTVSAPQPLARRANQPIWEDTETGYLTRWLTPPNWATPIQLFEVLLPAGDRVFYEFSDKQPAPEQQVWILQGQVNIYHGAETFMLRSGDCLAMRLDQPIIYSNRTLQAAKYVVAICDQASVQLSHARV